MVANIGLKFVVAADTVSKIAGIILEQVAVDISPIVVVVHTTVFGFIAMTKNLIGCNSPINYKSLADYTSLVI